jgi:NADPH-dependent curcumin reductase CurA
MAPISTAVGILGMPGATAWLGALDCSPFPKGGVVVVSTAAGLVGHTFGQLARQRGAGKLIGIAGGPTKCALLRERGFDVAIDYKVISLTSQFLSVFISNE